MNPKRLVTTLLSIILCGHAFGQAKDIDAALSDLAEKLASQVQDHGQKKIAVIDFTELDGSSSGELGKYIAEQLNVDLVMGKHTFSVLDRANLNNILAEHKLTATGLIDPDTAKKLGQFAGVDTIIMGTMTPKGQNFSLTAKIETTETAEIIGAARGEFKTDEAVTQLTSKPSTVSGSGGGDSTSNFTDDKPKILKTFGDLRVEIQQLQVVNGNQYLLTMTLINQNKKRSIWVALNCGSYGAPLTTITDANGYEFPADFYNNSGIGSSKQQDDSTFFHATEIKSGDSLTAKLKYISTQNRSASPGQANLQLGLLIGKDDVNNGYGHCNLQSIVTRIQAF